jgi:multidrug efflux pump subunit AcrB
MRPSIATIPLSGIEWPGATPRPDTLESLCVVGIVLLIGVVVNDGVVLVDYAERAGGSRPSPPPGGD